MAAAVGRLAEIGGGQVVVEDGRVVAEVACPIGGLLSDRPVEEVAGAVGGIGRAAHRLGVTLESPFMVMSFLALSVVPSLKLTDRGLVDVDAWKLVPLRV